MGFQNVLVAQSGGPTTAINATLAGVIKGALESERIEQIYGSLNGIEGVLHGRIIDIRRSIKSQADLKLLSVTPAMALGSCRFRLPKYENDPAIYKTSAATTRWIRPTSSRIILPKPAGISA